MGSPILTRNLNNSWHQEKLNTSQPPLVLEAESVQPVAINANPLRKSISLEVSPKFEVGLDIDRDKLTELEVRK
jgi:hypothetical protein